MGQIKKTNRQEKEIRAENESRYPVNNFLAGEELEDAIAGDNEEKVRWSDLNALDLRLGDDSDGLGCEVPEAAGEGGAGVEAVARPDAGRVPLVGRPALGLRVAHALHLLDGHDAGAAGLDARALVRAERGLVPGEVLGDDAAGAPDPGDGARVADVGDVERAAGDEGCHGGGAAHGVVDPGRGVHLGVGAQHGLAERGGGVGGEGGGREEEAQERVPREPGAGGAGSAVTVEDGEEVEVRVPREARGDEVRVLGLPGRGVRVEARHGQRGVLQHQPGPGHRGAAERGAAVVAAAADGAGGAPPRVPRQAALALRAPHRRRVVCGLGFGFGARPLRSPPLSGCVILGRSGS